MSSRRSEFTDLRWSSFGGVNVLDDPTDAAPNELLTAQGVYFSERGRLRCCHEGSSVDQVGSTNNVFQGLSILDSWQASTAYSVGDAISANGDIFVVKTTGAGTSGSTEPTWSNYTAIDDEVTDGTVTWVNRGESFNQPPSRVVRWGAAGVLVAINDYTVCLSNYTDPGGSFDGFLLRQPMPANVWTTATNYNSGTLIRPTYSENWVPFMFKAHRELATGGSAASRYLSGSSEPDWSTVTAVGDTVDDELASGFQMTWKAEKGYAASTYAVEFEDFLIVCVDGEPARAYHPDNLANDDLLVYANNNSTTHDWFDHSIALPYYPILMYREWYKTGTVDIVDSGSAHNVTVTTGNLRASGSPSDGAAISYHAGAHVFRKPTFDLSAYPKRGAMWAVTGSTSAVADYADIYTAGDPGSSQNDTFYRIGILEQTAMYRLPAVYNGRFCAVEGRQYAYSGIAAGTAIDADGTAGNDYVTLTGVDVTGSVAKGDEIIFYRDDRFPGGHAANIFDYTLSTRESWTATVKDVTFSTNSTIYLEETLKSTFSTIWWGTRRALEPYERRRIYFTGRPADVANGISADGRDFLWLDPNNNVIVGESYEGDITCLFPQNEYRLLVGLDSAIYEIVGDLPLDGTPPANFDVRRVVAGTGVYKDTAITSSDDGQYVYFCSATDNGVYQLYGSQVSRIDSKIRNHADYSGKFDTLSVSNKILYCFDKTNNVIWMLDLERGGWTHTKRVNSGQDATGTLPALELSDGSYASNNLYPTGDAGVFAPYRDDPSEDDRALVCYDNGTNYALRSLNYEDHALANLSHGVKIQTQHVDGGTTAPKRCRQARVLQTKPLLDDSGGSAFNEMQIAFSGGAGSTVVSRDVTPERSVTNEYDFYRAQGTGGRGDVGVSVTVGDGISAIGEVAEIEATVKPLPHRSRG